MDWIGAELKGNIHLRHDEFEKNMYEILRGLEKRFTQGCGRFIYSRDVVWAKNSQLFDESFKLSFEMTYSHISAILNTRQKTLARDKPLKL